ESYQRTGDRKWFVLLYERHYLPIYKVCNKLLRDSASAEDLAHDTFVNALEAIERFDGKGDGVNFARWLATIARNSCRSWIRRKRPLLPGEMPDIPDNGRTQPTHLFREAEAILAAMDEGPRRCWLMFYLEGYSYKEISERTGYSETEVKKYLRIAREALRKGLR
ncbi:MAG: RNA polymerase sigma factor, partial [Acidobacteria bacterium]|nr:RNA polymerase sigma factor [Acidobacteriota bacterium]